MKTLWTKVAFVVVAVALAFGCGEATSDAPDSTDNPYLGGKSDEFGQAPFGTLGHFEGVRAVDGQTEAWFDAQKYTYTSSGVFDLHVYFEQVGDEGDGVPQADLFMMDFNVSPDQYLQLFEQELDGSLELPRWESLVYTQSATAEPLTTGGRLVTLSFDNADEEDTRRGETTFELDESGEISSFTMRRWAKKRGFFGFGGGWDLVFEGTAEGLTKTAAGLALRDEGEVGRLTDESDIRSASDDSSPLNFDSILGNAEIPDHSGEWVGIWRNGDTDETGALTVVLGATEGTDISGTASFEGTDCLGEVELSARLAATGNSLDGSLSEANAYFEASIIDDGVVMAGSVYVREGECMGTELTIVAERQ